MSMVNEIKANSNKEIALSFLRFVVAGKIREGYERFVAKEFIHHNPHFLGDRESLLIAMEKNQVQFPNKILEVKHVIEEGNLVMLHSSMRPNPISPALALLHLFRFKGDKIVELWDMAQPVPVDSINERAMF
jgi:predicted SnoaL-like aldol condensation-catalyzing enzyme